MLFTILILVVAVTMYLLSGMLFLGNKKQSNATLYAIAKRAVRLVALVLVIWGVNRTGLGTSNYLVNQNPMILQDMVESMRDQQTKQSSRELTRYIARNAPMLEINAPIAGNVDGSKVIYLFTAATCPFCHRVASELNRVIADDSEVKLVIKNFSVHGILSDIPSKATIAAKLQSNEKAVALDKLLMSSTKWYEDARSAGDQTKAGAIVLKNVLNLAKEVGLDVKRLEKDMNEAPEVAREMNQVRELSQRFNITGTPFLIINGQAFPGAIPYDQIRAALK
ncbi:MAG: thioredoxin domain-containing protein [Alphaproteobacteria bacterium]|nr:thioredoxin domain-containing protein [Alphaproteobacteria bacterium]